MTTERDTTRLVRAWLREDDHESAARVIEAALEVVERTPQRRAWRARHTPDRLVGPLGRVLAPLAAVLLVAVLVIVLFPFRGGPGTLPTATPSPSPSPSAGRSASEAPAATGASPTPTQPPSPESIGPSAAAFFPEDGPLPVGRTYMTRSGVSFSIDIPSEGWISSQGFDLHQGALGTADGVDMIFWDTPPTNTYADPCTHTPRDPPMGRTPTEMVDAVASAPGTDVVIPPEDVTVGGRPAKHVGMFIPATIPCRAGGSEFLLWYDVDPDAGRYPFEAESSIQVWIVDVGGAVVWIDTELYRGALSGPQDDLHAIIDSIAFE